MKTDADRRAHTFYGNAITVPQAVRVVLKGRETKLLGIVSLFLVGTLVDLVAVSLIGAYSVYLVSGQIVFPRSVSLFLARLWSGAGELDLASFSLLVAVFYVFRCAVAVGIQKVIVDFSVDQQIHLTRRLMSAFNELPFDAVRRADSARTLQNATENASSVANKFVSPLLRLVSDFMVVCAILVFLFVVDFLATSFVALCLGVASFALSWKHRRRLPEEGRRFAAAQVSVIKTVDQNIRGLRELRVFGLTGKWKRALETSTAAMKHSSQYYLVSLSTHKYYLETFVVCILAGFAVVSRQSADSPEAQLTVLGTFAGAAFRLLPSINQIMHAVNNIRFTLKPLNSVAMELLSVESHYRLTGSGPENASYHEATNFEAKPSDAPFVSLRLRGVSYTFPEATEATLRDVSFDLDRNDVVGVIGPSGSGKSTFIDLLLGLAPSSSGEARVNGERVTLEGEEWRRRCALIPQEIFIIEGTFRESVTLLASVDVDDARLSSALQGARLNDVVSHLPSGLDARVAEGGKNLSGGQRQRMGIARALYFGREIVLMDEPTSALDESTEKDIIEYLASLRGTTTLVIVTHRKSLLSLCNKVYELSEGCLKPVADAAGRNAATP
jgi:ABC-type multidrug transport system fused ATPase/permease subunit